jgi:hypothetical protein
MKQRVRTDNDTPPLQCGSHLSCQDRAFCKRLSATFDKTSAGTCALPKKPFASQTAGPCLRHLIGGSLTEHPPLLHGYDSLRALLSWYQPQLSAGYPSDELSPDGTFHLQNPLASTQPHATLSLTFQTGAPLLRLSLDFATKSIYLAGSGDIQMGKPILEPGFVHSFHIQPLGIIVVEL